MNEDLLLLKELEALKVEHKELDDQIDHDAYLDDFTRQRLKRRRLTVRTRITELEQIVYPNISA